MDIEFYAEQTQSEMTHRFRSIKSKFARTLKKEVGQFEWVKWEHIWRMCDIVFYLTQFKVRFRMEPNEKKNSNNKKNSIDNESIKYIYRNCAHNKWCISTEQQQQPTKS